MTAFRFRSNVILAFILGVGSVADSETVYSADEMLEEVIVSGVKDPRRDSLISGGTNRSLSSDDVVAPVISTGDMVGQLAGAASNGQGGLFQSYSLRGFSRSRIRTEISGVPIISDRRAGNSLSFLPATFIDSIRADMGPASSLYGSGAMGGVLSASLREPEQTALNLSLGSAGNYRSLGAETRLSEHTAIAASHKSANESRAANNDLLNTGFRQSAVYLRNQRTLGGLSINGEVITGFGHDIGKSSSLFPDDRNSIYPHDNHRIINLRVANQNGWFAQAYVHDQDWASRTERIGTRQNTSRYQSQTYGAVLSHRRSDQAGQHRWGLELTARTNVDITEVEQALAGSATITGLVENGSERVTGAFADRSWFFNDTTLRIGGRIDQSYVANEGSSSSKTDLNGQIQIETTFAEDWLIAVEVGTAYRLPTLSELYFSGETPRGAVQGNPFLTPEETVGSQITLSNNSSELRVEFSAFYNRVEDYIERVRAADETLTYQNLQSGEIWGFDGLLYFEGEGKLQHRIQWQWQRGEADNGEVLDDLPPPELSYTGTWERGTWAVAVDLGYRFSRDDHGPGEIPLGSAVIGAASITCEINAHWSTALSISNGFNRAYRTSADENAPLANERAVHLSLRWIP